jgi:AcrR family transcriptional regulator
VIGVDSRQAPVGTREAQRRRTRAAIVDATRALVAGGRTPSVEEVATAAEVSRRTIYLHFPTLDQLLLDATAGLLSEPVDAWLDGVDLGADAAERADALARAIVAVAPATLPLGRRLIALTVGTPVTDGAARRGYRRVAWIERALEPARERLGPERYDRLVSALSVVLGWEALVVLQDVRGLDAAASEDALRWMTRALVRAALDEAAGAPR